MRSHRASRRPGAAKRTTAVRRRQIVDAALAIVVRGGVGDLSVARVAKACGVVPSALYRHFRGRDEVVEGLVEALGERLRANLETARAAAPHALGRLRRLYDLHLEMAGGGAFPRLVFSDEVSSPASPRRRHLFAILSDYLSGIALVVAEGRREGDLRSDVEPRAAAALLLGAVQHTAVLAHLGGPDFDLGAHAARVWRAFVRSIAPSEPGRRPSPRSPRRSP